MVGSEGNIFFEYFCVCGEKKEKFIRGEIYKYFFISLMFLLRIVKLIFEIYDLVKEKKFF